VVDVSEQVSSAPVVEGTLIFFLCTLGTWHTHCTY
jgi:hypothetical protein